ncbi:sulfatase [Marinilongibacter aquaticus]|uniref:sulfatase n=1 Tax=Marinilongibacter aquaticus TaxID=2975157 RepID=UPI0021BD9556|nr:sulfatase [Marinilongibacter aquaticus]UBM57485.1 sulfatase [Marinilongibacter aquaticus]
MNSRKNFNPGLLVFGLCCSLAFLFQNCQKEEKPNFLFILVDDLGYPDLSCTGSSYYETPNVDAIAKNAVVFSQGYAASRVCSPSRASIMTGQLTASHGITNWIGEKSGMDWRSLGRQSKSLPADYVHSLPKEYSILPELLKTQGYTTFFAGKWHLGDEGSYPEDHGFDINKGGFEKGSPAGGYFAPFNNPKLENHEGGENLSLRLANETANFLESQPKDKPFLAYLAFYAVHGPIQTTAAKWKKYRDKAEEQGLNTANGFEMERLLPIRKAQDNPVYAGLVETMDDAVGIVMQKLKELGLDKNTIVIFTSDNGGVASGDAYSSSMSPLRGGKGYQWEGGTRVPFFVSIPGVSSKTIDFPVTGADFLPTLADYAGVTQKPFQQIDGESLRPLIEGKSLENRALYWHYPHYGNQGGEPSSVILKGEWKLIHYYEDGRNELYNLSEDPSEKINIYPENEEQGEKLYQELKTWLDSRHALYPQPDPEFSEKKFTEWRENMVNKKMPQLEKQRESMLSNDYTPNKDWWGSQVTRD